MFRYSIDPVDNQNTFEEFDQDNEDDDVDLIDSDSDYGDDEELEGVTTDQPLYCLPMYSMLPNDKQALVFKQPPDGCRFCVIATNVAETSLTIPNIKYVVDPGKVIRCV